MVTLLVRNQDWRLYQEDDGELLLVNEESGREIADINQAEFAALKAIIEQAEALWQEENDEAE